ncbi:MAG: SemiSWEET transporter [Thomasclavelia sp.]|jgi:MtN3 and saliva related transmembrane protein|nr:SemiSWEET transporter [Tissierellia bacterium]MDD8049224.1 SemiSWEET transporter [Thomasclavelia sp.]
MLEFIGPIAACLTTLSFVPQAVQVIKTKDTSGISLGMYSMFVLGVFLWIIHGVNIGDISLIVANGITFILAGIILIFKIKYK